VVGSCLAAGAFYLLVYYAATVFYGPKGFGGPAFANLGGGDAWGGLVKTAIGGVAIISSLAIWSSQGAAVNASFNPSSRILFALSRARLLPEPLGRTHRAHQTPTVAILCLGGFTLVLAIVLEKVTGSPLDAFALLGTILTLCLILVYMGTCASCVAYYLRRGLLPAQTPERVQPAAAPSPPWSAS